jgi:hypothetical protein
MNEQAEAVCNLHQRQQQGEVAMVAVEGDMVPQNKVNLPTYRPQTATAILPAVVYYIVAPVCALLNATLLCPLLLLPCR